VALRALTEMEQLPKLKARISNLLDLQSLMSAMRALAASHVQEAQGALDGIRKYTLVVEEAIAAGVSLLPANTAAATGAQKMDDLLILICSEHGFVGGFNERLIERAVATLKDGQQLAVVGHRGAQLLAEQGNPSIWNEAMATQVGGVLGASRRVAAHLVGTSRVELIFGAYCRGGRYEIETRRVLPLDPALLVRANGRSPPLHHLTAEVLLQSLAEEYLLAELSLVIMESLASENAARLQVMEAADRNIDHRLQQLELRSHTLRQESITAELLDLMTGAEAVTGSDG
jgi:F-type H+-transporting ATPase subunit gamma